MIHLVIAVVTLTQVLAIYDYGKYPSRRECLEQQRMRTAINDDGIQNGPPGQYYFASCLSDSEVVTLLAASEALQRQRKAERLDAE